MTTCLCDTERMQRGLEWPTVGVTVSITCLFGRTISLVLDSSMSRVASDCNLKLQGESLVSLNSDMGPIAHK
jgi:hypothetical protein